MSDDKNVDMVEREFERLQTLRDELKVRLHLAKADAQDEWEKLESRWRRVEEELTTVKTHSEKPVRKIGEATRQVMNELKSGYTRIRDELQR